MPSITLASASPRRQALVGAFGLPVTVQPAEVDESPLPDEPPADVARRLAKLKAAAVPGEVVLAADTVVVADGVALGKPTSPSEAAAMLRSLRGRAHVVVTGIAVRTPNGEIDGAVETTVWMRNLTDEEIAAYVASGQPLDKAGAYGIQDAEYRPVERIAGCYLNVVGLPLCAVGEALRDLGVIEREEEWFGQRDWRRCQRCQCDWPPK